MSLFDKLVDEALGNQPSFSPLSIVAEKDDVWPGIIHLIEDLGQHIVRISKA